MLKILLFDVDGVLLEAHGYVEAERAAIDHLSDRMGQAPIRLTHDEIAYFESTGMTNEWDSGAMCTALLVMAALGEHPELVRASFTDTLAAVRESGLVIARPDFTSLLRALVADHPHGIHNSAPVLSALKSKYGPVYHPLLEEILGDVYRHESPFTYILQHFTIGSQRFETTYGAMPLIETHSYLKKYDKPNFSVATRTRLLEAVHAGEAHAVVFTARPSLPPTDLIGTEHDAIDPARHPPEGDLALETLGLDGVLPLMAGGRVMWLALHHGLPVESFIKPSPVQALAAAGAALCRCERDALHAAFDAAQHGRLNGPLTRLQGETVELIVFEDSTGGVKATRGAGDILSGLGIDVRTRAYGIAVNESKVASLRAQCDAVFPSINEAVDVTLR